MNMQGLLALLISAAMSCGAMADTTSVPADVDAALIGSATQTMERRCRRCTGYRRLSRYS